MIGCTPWRSYWSPRNAGCKASPEDVYHFNSLAVGKQFPFMCFLHWSVEYTQESNFHVAWNLEACGWLGTGLSPQSSGVQFLSISCEIHGGIRDTGIGFLLLTITPPLLHTIYHNPVRCAVTLTRQHIITFSVNELGPSSLAQNLAGYRVSMLVLQMWIDGGSKWGWHGRHHDRQETYLKLNYSKEERESTFQIDISEYCGGLEFRFLFTVDSVSQDIVMCSGNL
jgi:hypothetical protein